MKAGMILALGVGYVAGARAGRGRYRQIVSASQRVADALERYAGGGSEDGQQAEPSRDAAAPQPNGTWRGVVRAFVGGEVADDGGRSALDLADPFDADMRRSSVGATDSSDEFERLVGMGTRRGPSRGE